MEERISEYEEFYFSNDKLNIFSRCIINNYIISQWILGGKRMLMMKSPHYFISSLLKDKFHYSISCEKVGVALDECSNAPCLYFSNNEVLVVSECFFNQHFVRGAEYWVAFSNVQILIWLLSRLSIGLC